MSEHQGNNQRPFHICPECSAYNAKFNKACWRCDHDMSTAIDPAGVIGYRLEQLDNESKEREKEPAKK